MIEATLDLQPEGAMLLAAVCASDLFSQDGLPARLTICGARYATSQQLVSNSGPFDYPVSLCCQRWLPVCGHRSNYRVSPSIVNARQ